MKSLQEEFARRHGHCSMVELYNRKSTLKISNPIASIAAIKKDRKHLLADLKTKSWFAPGMHQREYMIKHQMRAKRRIEAKGKSLSLPSVILQLWS
jgi:hypothetical protein